MRISDWSSDVCSSDLPVTPHHAGPRADRVAVAAGEDRGADCLALLGQRQDRGEARRFGWGQPVGAVAEKAPRSDKRRVGKECGSQCRSRRSPCHIKKKKYNNKLTELILKKKDQ